MRAATMTLSKLIKELGIAAVACSRRLASSTAAGARLFSPAGRRPATRN